MTASPGSEDLAALMRLRWHWEKTYAINCEDGLWTAISAAAPDAVLTAASSGELRTAMQHDYAARAIRSGATAARWAGYSSL